MLKSVLVCSPFVVCLFELKPEYWVVFLNVYVLCTEFCMWMWEAVNQKCPRCTFLAPWIKTNCDACPECLNVEGVEGQMICKSLIKQFNPWSLSWLEYDRCLCIVNVRVVTLVRREVVGSGCWPGCTLPWMVMEEAGWGEERRGMDECGRSLSQTPRTRSQDPLTDPWAGATEVKRRRWACL